MNSAHFKTSRNTVLEHITKPLKDGVKLSPDAMPLDQRLAVLQRHSDIFRHYLKYAIGFQGNLGLSFNHYNCDKNNQICESDSLQGFWKMHINNGGEPTVASGYVLQTKYMEIAVLDYFADLWQLKSPADDASCSYWGYITSMGASEANMLALWNAREYLNAKPLLYKPNEPTKDAEEISKASEINLTSENPNPPIPVVFFSQCAYFGHMNALNMLQMKTFHELGSGEFPCPLKYPEDYPGTFCEELLDQNGWPYAVPCEEDDSMHIPSLLKLVTAFISRGHPPIIIFTIGTTSIGAYDTPQRAITQLVPVLKQHNMYHRRVSSRENPTEFEMRNGFWFHIDGALGAGNLPFLEMAINKGLLQNMFPNGFPVFDFRIPEVMSISMSIYKWFGLPFPAAVHMMRKEYRMKPLSRPLSGIPLSGTLGGSRGGHGALLTWELLSKTSYDDFIAEVVRVENVMSFLLKKLEEVEEIHGDLWIVRSPGSLMVSFKRPKDGIVAKYSLPSFPSLVTVEHKGRKCIERRNCARISVMPHVQSEVLEMIIDELKTPGAFATNKW